jgi:hypothetical protein
MRRERTLRLAAEISLCLLTLAVSQAYAANVLVFPQFVTGGGYISTVSLVNTNFSTPVSGSLALFNQNGSARIVAMEGRTAASAFTVSIPAGGTAVLRTTPLAGDTVVGMAKFTSDFPVGGVVRFEFAGGQVGVLNAPVQSYGTLVLNTADGNDTGIAIANPGQTPINISLVHTDENGETLEVLDPPELNPLPPNGQIAKFITQFGFAQTANRSKGSIQIHAKAGGEFSAFALLLRNGMLSSTAVVRGATGKFRLGDFADSYEGKWRNTTFASEGGASLSLAFDDERQTVVINIALTGNLFGAGTTGTTTLTGAFKLTGFSATGDSPDFGPVTMVIGLDGAWSLTANSVPSTSVASFKIEGTAHPDKITGNYTVTFRSGGATAQGTLALNNAGG